MTSRTVEEYVNNSLECLYSTWEDGDRSWDGREFFDDPTAILRALDVASASLQNLVVSGRISVPTGEKQGAYKRKREISVQREECFLCKLSESELDREIGQKVKNQQCRKSVTKIIDFNGKAFHWICLKLGERSYRPKAKNINVDNLIKQSLRWKCSVCKKDNAPGNCDAPRCRSRYHFSCAIRNDCQIDLENALLWCPSHAESSGPLKMNFNISVHEIPKASSDEFQEDGLNSAVLSPNKKIKRRLARKILNPERISLFGDVTTILYFAKNQCSKRLFRKRPGIVYSIYESLEAFKESKRPDRPRVNISQIKNALPYRFPKTKKSSVFYLDRNLRKCSLQINPITAVQPVEFSEKRPAKRLDTFESPRLNVSSEIPSRSIESTAPYESTLKEGLLLRRAPKIKKELSTNSPNPPKMNNSLPEKEDLLDQLFGSFPSN